jgi:adenosine deaminase
MRPTTATELARAAGIPLPVEDIGELYRYDSLDSFLAVFWFVQSLLRTPGDWERLAYESLVDGAAHGLRYREMFFTPARHLADGADLREIIAALGRGLAAAEAETGARCMLVLDMDRAYGPAAGRELVEDLLALKRHGHAERVVGVGMDSTELGVDLASFARAYEIAARNGLRRTAHAGEAVGCGADNVRIALDVLHAERIDHGIAVAEDGELTRRMAGERIPLTVCPTSNIVIANRYARLADHPLRRMRGDGLLVTINTDDPAMTELDLGREYRDVAGALDLSREEVVAIALEALDATWLDESDRSTLRRSFEADIRALDASAGGDAVVHPAEEP